MDYRNEIKDKCFNFKLKRSCRIVTRFMDNILRDYGIKITQFHIISIIENNTKCKLTILSNILGMDRTTFGRAMQVLIENGFIDFIREKRDKRIKELYLTTKGKDIFIKIYPIWENINNKLIDLLKNKNMFEIEEKDLEEII